MSVKHILAEPNIVVVTGFKEICAVSVTCLLLAFGIK